MKPRENTSSSSPRTPTTRSPSRSTASPQVASQKGHVRNAVVIMGGLYLPFWEAAGGGEEIEAGLADRVLGDDDADGGVAGAAFGVGDLEAGGGAGAIGGGRELEGP